MNKYEINKILSKYFDKYQISELLQKQTGLSKSQLFLCNSLPRINNQWVEKITELWEKKYPFEYIIQKAEFYWLELYVDERVLIPRNDTEIMVDSTIHKINSYTSKITYLDIWTWSSCIPIAVLKNCNTQYIHQSYVVDISSEALDVSKRNIEDHLSTDTVQQLQWSLLEPVASKLTDTDLVITANLPYIKDNDYENMDKETVQYEPDLALYGWKDTGFELYEILIGQLKNIKKQKNIQNIILFIEIWFDQEKYSQEYLKKLWFTYNLHKDNWWIIRCIEINI